MFLEDPHVLHDCGVDIQSRTWNMHRRVRKADATEVAVVWTMSESEVRSDAAMSREV